MELVRPTLRHEASWTAGLKEFNDEELWEGFWNVPEKPTDLKPYIQRTEQHARGENLPEHWVPSDTYWLIDNDEFIGHVNVRHALNDRLKKIGGHIGYAIRPSQRGHGYGTKILSLALEKARKIGLEKVMITCDEDHAASQKIIERNGGLLTQQLEVDNKPIRHYWITL